MEVSLERFFQGLAILAKGGASSGREPQQGLGHFPTVSFFNLHITRFHQSRQVTGKIAFAQPGFVQQIKKITFFGDGENGDDH